MGTLLGYDDVRRQSEGVWKQFGESKWIPYSQINCRLPNRRDPNELRNCGVGKFAVLAAMGESLQEAIPLLKKHREKFDLVTCDKGFPILMAQGLKPDFVQLCDCNIPYKWLEPWVEQTDGVKLLATTYANVEWTTRWKGPTYFYVNKDALDSQKRFLPILGNPDSSKFTGLEDKIAAMSDAPVRVIPAGSNVSNAMLTFMVGADETNRANWAGYEHYFLTGYDYCWRPKGSGLSCKTGSYYAFEDPEPKRYYMNHRTMLDINGDIVQTSENLLFSAKWMFSYLAAFDLPVTNCSGRGILDVRRQASLEKSLEKCSPSREKREAIFAAAKDIQMAQAMRLSAEARLDSARRSLWGKG